MGLFVGKIRKHELLQEKSKLHWQMLNITNAKANATKAATEMMQVGTDYEADSLVYKKLEERKDTLTRSMIKWKGKIVPQLAMSVGYAPLRECPNKSITELAKLADERMYDAKRNFYISTGQDRRGR